MATFAILVIVGYALYVMSPAEREKLLKKIVSYAREAKDRADEARLAPDPFRDALRQRTPWPVVTLALVFLNVTMYLFMLVGSGSLGDPDTMIAWGGNIGLRTTNDEWSRLVMSLFIHGGMFHLLVNIAGLVQVGCLVERLAGHLTFAFVYFAAGILAGLQNLSTQSTAVTYGASSAILGIYGLFLAIMLWNMLANRAAPESLALLETRAYVEPGESLESVDPKLKIPLEALKRLAPAAGIFLLWNVADGLETSELAALLAGFVSGLALASTISEEKPALPKIAAAVAVTIAVVAGSAYPLRGVSDVRPEIVKMVEIEDRTVASYQKAVDQFKLGNLSADALAKQIDLKITPELRAASARLKTLGKIPAEHQPLVKDAEEYLRLRDESWTLRSSALHKSNMVALRRADKTERASLEAFERIKPVEQK